MEICSSSKKFECKMVVSFKHGRSRFLIFLAFCSFFLISFVCVSMTDENKCITCGNDASASVCTVCNLKFCDVCKRTTQSKLCPSCAAAPQKVVFHLCTRGLTRCFCLLCISTVCVRACVRACVLWLCVCVCVCVCVSVCIHLLSSF